MDKVSEKEITKIISITIVSNNKIPRKEINQGGERSLYWKPQDTDETNWRWPIKMERYNMFLNWKNQYC